jgi:calcium/calmodulin-dependent protein kinase (CaM kinase) II
MDPAKSAVTDQQFIDLTYQLLDSISRGDWEAYQSLCDPTLTAFEPEARGQLVAGLDFHHFYFLLGGGESKRANTVCAPHVRLLGDDAVVISYVRLVQCVDSNGNAQTHRFEETRVWQRRDGQWRHVHFHRSPGT